MKITLLNERPKSVNEFYSGMHWTKRKAEVDRVHALVKYSFPIGERKLIYADKVNIFITAYFKNRPLDSDNVFAKIYVDGLKGCVIYDDTPKYVGYVATRSEVDKDNPRVEIQITMDEEKSYV